ncbi:MAG: YigZ family protein [Halieaceae bacterium]|jgi:uncharacterized YigZ family protein|nr:YigZ family protein [Halieaceae bacterium]
MENTYSVPAQSISNTYIVKKSQFIAYIFQAEERENAMAHLQVLKAKYPGARHHCWAYLLGDPKQPMGQAFSDDGEPSGTAGKPILNVLQHKNVGDVMVVVVRYFGGIKLGAGGLVRAYSTATQLAMDLLPTAAKVPRSEVKICLDYGLESGLRRHIDGAGACIVETDYGERVNLLVDFPDIGLKSLREYCAARKAIDLQE